MEISSQIQNSPKYHRLLDLAEMKLLLILLSLSSPLFADKVRDYWFSGAEISSFNLSQSHYGKSHPGHAELIFVTEPFLTNKQVKDESGPKDSSTDILKLNALTTFNTGIYSYRTMTSTFRPLDLEEFPHALKSNTSIQDWCGQSFQQFNLLENNWNIELRSYFETFADKNLKLPEAHLEDELWITLRLDPKKLPTGEIDVIPGTIFTRLNHQPTKAFEATATLDLSRDKIATYTLAYPSLGRALSIGFEKEFPHIIRAWTEVTPKGKTIAALRKRITNVPYWNLSDPKDAEKRRELGLSPVAD